VSFTRSKLAGRAFSLIGPAEHRCLGTRVSGPHQGGGDCLTGTVKLCECPLSHEQLTRASPQTISILAEKAVD
jgi:hypothetical protein